MFFKRAHTLTDCYDADIVPGRLKLDSSFFSRLAVQAILRQEIVAA